MRENNKYELIKFKDGEFELDINVSPEEKTIWMTLDEIAVLFEKDRSVIGRHIRKIFDSKELDEITSGHFLPGSGNHRPAKVVVITHPKNESFESDKYKVIKVDKFHDRYLFVDDKAYHFGESFNKLGTDISTCTYLPNFSLDNFLELTGLKI